MNGTNLDDLLVAGKPRVTKLVNLPSDVRQAREAEQRRRAAAAFDLAGRALRALHPADFRDLHEQAKAKVLAESGPLPGDDLIRAAS